MTSRTIKYGKRTFVLVTDDENITDEYAVKQVKRIEAKTNAPLALRKKRIKTLQLLRFCGDHICHYEFKED